MPVESTGECERRSEVLERGVRIGSQRRENLRTAQPSGADQVAKYLHDDRRQPLCLLEYDPGTCQERPADLGSRDDIDDTESTASTRLDGVDRFPLGLGCMGMSGMCGPADEHESIATIHAALDAGITLLDTGDYYGAGHNELLIGRALRDRRDKAVLSVKFGALRGPDGSWLGMDTRPASVRNFLAYTLMRLGVDHIDIYRPAASIPLCLSRTPLVRSRIS